MMRSPLAAHHPTGRLGWVVSRPRSAGFKARVMASRSNSVNIRHPQAIIPDQPFHKCSSKTVEQAERNTTAPTKPSQPHKLLVAGDGLTAVGGDPTHPALLPSRARRRGI